MRKLILHMGLHKTASSSFQDTCAKNKDLLLSQGYIYPEFTDAEASRSFKANHSHPILSQFSTNPARLHGNIRMKIKDVAKFNKDLEEQLREVLSSESDVIISGEGISYLNNRELQNFKQMIHSFDREIVPICLVRSPYSFHCSGVQQSIKAGKNIPLSKLFEQSEIIRTIKRVFPDTSFFSFAESCKHDKGPVGFLFDKMQIKSSEFELVESNTSMSNQSVRAQNIFNSIEPSVINNKANPNFVRLPPHKGDKFLLTDKELNLMKPALNKENRLFLSLLGEEFCDVDHPVTRGYTMRNFLNDYHKFLKPEHILTPFNPKIKKMKEKLNHYHKVLKRTRDENLSSDSTAKE